MSWWMERGKTGLRTPSDRTEQREGQRGERGRREGAAREREDGKGLRVKGKTGRGCEGRKMTQGRKDARWRLGVRC